jgi:para-aminobenzoate synthetase/4-amino-4-deoxychorismate lyase
VHPAAVARGLSTLEDEGTVGTTQLGVSEAAYTEAIEQVRRHIGAGDVYQINYTAPVRFRAPGDPRTLYRRLRGR